MEDRNTEGKTNSRMFLKGSDIVYLYAKNKKPVERERMERQDKRRDNYTILCIKESSR